jgi:galactitol-specific phosphotransferase system IIC component
VTQPSKRDVFKPVELIVLSAVMALFVGLTVLLSTRNALLAAIFFGVAFIVVLVVIAMMVLTFKPNKSEQTELDDENLPPSGH